MQQRFKKIYTYRKNTPLLHIFNPETKFKRQIQRLNTPLDTRQNTIGIATMERKRTMIKEKRLQAKLNKSLTKEEILRRRIVNLSTLELTQSETDLLRRGLIFVVLHHHRNQKA